MNTLIDSSATVSCCVLQIVQGIKFYSFLCINWQPWNFFSEVIMPCIKQLSGHRILGTTTYVRELSSTTLKNLSPQIICNTCYSSNIDMSRHGYYWIRCRDIYRLIGATDVCHKCNWICVDNYSYLRIIASFSLLNTLCSYNV